MDLIIEGIGLCLLLFLICFSGIRKGAVNMVFLYGEDVRKRTVELGMTTEERIHKRSVLFKTFGLLSYFTYLLVCVYGINGAREFKDGFLQMMVIFLIMGVFDRLAVDLYWVGHTKAWIIPGTEDLQPYIPVKVHILKWITMLIFYPAMTAILALIMSAVL